MNPTKIVYNIQVTVFLTGVVFVCILCIIFWVQYRVCDFWISATQVCMCVLDLE